MALVREDRESQDGRPRAAFGAAPKQKSDTRDDHLPIGSLNHGEVSPP
jgi:hypothetical protein